MSYQIVEAIIKFDPDVTTPEKVLKELNKLGEVTSYREGDITFEQVIEGKTYSRIEKYVKPAKAIKEYGKQ